MAKLTQSGAVPITLPAGHVIPPRGSLELTNDAIRGDNWPTLSGLILSGQVAVEFDPDPEPEQTNPEAAEPQSKKVKGA